MKRYVCTHLFLFVGIMLLFVVPASLRAQGAVSLSEAISSNQVGVKISGRASTYFQPMAVMELRNLSEQPLDIALPLGSLLKNEQETACDLVLFGSDPSPIHLEVLPSNSAPVIYPLLTYCLDLEGFPSLEASYRPTGEASAEIQTVLRNIQQDQAEQSFAAQIAIWSAATNQDLAQLQAKQNADYTLYAGQVERFLGTAQATPTVPPTATTIVTATTPGEAQPTEVPPLTEEEQPTAEAQATEQSGAEPQPPTEDEPTESNLMLFAVVVGGIVLSGLGLWALMQRQPNRGSLADPALKVEPPPQPKVAEKKDTPLPPKMRCVICQCPLDANQKCTNLACSTGVLRAASFHPDEDTDATPVADEDEDETAEQPHYHERTDPIKGDFLGEDENQHEQKHQDDLTLKLKVISGDQKGGEYKITGNSQGLQGIISRGEAKQITLPHDRNVSMPHAVLDVWRRNNQQQDRIRDLGSQNGTFVNGEKLKGRKWRTLKDGDLLRFGTTKLRYHQSERELTYEDQSQEAISLRARTNRWLITRHEIQQIDFQSNDTTISVPHVYIRLHNGSLEVRDISSNNAVRLLGQSLKGRTHLFDQDVIRIGRQTKIKVITDISGIPQQIDQWDRQNLIHHGGMADVYRVEHLDNDTTAALKIPRPSKYRQANQQGKKYKQLFEQECELTKQIKHPNFVHSIESGQIKGLELPYLALEYIDGPSVYAIIHKSGKSAAFSLPNAAEVAFQVAQALQELHKHQYIHCDIKPSNIMIDNRGQVFLIDLGVATPIGDPYSKLGVPQYLPKEVLADQPVNIDTDIYSLGQTLFKMLTTESLPAAKRVARQYEDRNPGVERTGISNISNRPSTLLREKVTSPEMQRIIARSTHQTRQKRYQDIETLLADLAPLRAGADLKSLVEDTGWAIRTAF